MVEHKANALQAAALKYACDGRIKSERLISHEFIDAKASAVKEMGVEDKEEEGPTVFQGLDDSWSMEAKPLLSKACRRHWLLYDKPYVFNVHLRVTAAFECNLCDLCVLMSS